MTIVGVVLVVVAAVLVVVRVDPSKAANIGCVLFGTQGSQT